MLRKKALILTALLLGTAVSPAAYSGTLNLDGFLDSSPAEIDLSSPPVNVLMATVTTSGTGGGDDAVDTVITISGGVPANGIDQICVHYNGVQVGACITSPGSLTNLVYSLDGTQKGKFPFEYYVTLNGNAAGSTIVFTVESISAANLNDTIPLPQSTDPTNIVGGTTFPSVTTNTATGIVHAPSGGPNGQANLGGNVSTDGGDALTDIGVIWDTQSGFDPLQSEGTRFSMASLLPISPLPSNFADNLTALTPGIYYFRAYATNTIDERYGDELSFAIKELPTLLVNPAIIDIQPDSATLGGRLTADGFDSISDCGVEWRTDSGTYGDGNSGSASFGVCSVDVDFTVNTGTTLTTGQTYFFRSYAINSLGPDYSANEGSFKPVAKPTVTTGGFTGKTQTQATLAGTVTNNGGDALTDCTIKWGETSDVVEPYTYTYSGSAGACTVNVEFTVLASGLSPGTTYYYRAFATNGAGEAPASSEQQFTTDAGPPTLVATPTVETVGAVSGQATLGGELSSTGGGTISDCGVDWRIDTGTYGDLNSGSASFGICSVGAPFTADATGLTNGTTYYFRSWATNESGTAYSANESSFVPYTTPSVTTGADTGVTETEATLAGTVTDDGGNALTDCTIKWGETSDVVEPYTYSDSASAGVCSVNLEFTVGASSLSPGTTYYYRAFASNAAGEAPASGEQQFTTLVGLPTVATRAVENLTTTAADLGGNVTADGGAPITERGVVWNTSNTWNLDNPPASQGTVEPMGSGTGLFIATVTYSPPEAESTLIYFRAYASNDSGATYAYSDVQSFQYVSGQPKDIVPKHITGHALKFSWTPGLGEGSLVVIRETFPTVTSEVVPDDLYDYLALPPYPNPDYSLPPPEVNGGSNGNYVVYQGSADNVWITGLALNTQYTITIYDYTGTDRNQDDPPATAVLTTTDEAVHNYDNRASCGTDCHNGHGAFHPRGPELSDVCTAACHVAGGPAENKTGFTKDTAISAAGHPTPGSNPNVDTVDCGTCHELHNPGGANTTWSTHSVTGTQAYNKAFLRANVDKYVPNAATPAYLHGGDSAAENTDKPKVGETPAETPNRAVEGGDEATARGYCQVCHTYTKYHRNTGTTTGQLLPDGSTSADHPAWPLDPGQFPECHDGINNDSCGDGIGATPTFASAQAHCGECHEHNNNFVGVGGSTSCVVCHEPGGAGTTAANSRPAITTQFDRLTVHLQGGSSTLDPADCEVCHEQSTHNQSAMVVRGKDLDNAGSFFSQPNEGIYNPPISTGHGEALEPHCLSCHDADYASALGGSADAPFTATTAGRLTQLEVIGTYWSAAAHNRDLANFPANPVTCLGDGTNGCHASGHGTESNSLLASWGTTGNPATNTPLSPTDFCLVCHDADGPSSIDVQDQFFNIGLNPNTGVPEKTNFRATADDGAKVNQRHDAFNIPDDTVFPNYTDGDQTYSSGSVSCADCHSPHVDAPTASLYPPYSNIADPDTGEPLPPYRVTNTYQEDGANVDYDLEGALDPTKPAGCVNPTQSENHPDCLSQPIPDQPDYIQFCLTCHDGNTTNLPNVAMDSNMRNIAADHATDYHGGGAGSGAGASTNKGGMKQPWVTASDYAANYDPPTNYAAMNCTTCHGAHGSDNIFNLRSSINVAGVQMTIGGDGAGVPVPSRIQDPTVYDLPRTTETARNSGIFVQADHDWGAWCSFCHRMTTHASKTEVDSCTKGHKHGGGAF